MQQRNVIGIGEVLWDCFADSRRPGGAPANVAFHAAQLGLRGIVCSRVGRDALGGELRAYLEAHELEATYVQEDLRHPTGTVTVDARDPGHPTYVIHEDVAWDHLEFDAALELLMASAAAVCFGTLAQRGTQSRDTIHQALTAAKTARRVYDVNLRQQWFAREWVEHSLRAAQIVKLNADEVGVVAELLALGSAEPTKFAAALQQEYAVDTVCVTRAAEGCLLVSADEVVDVPGRVIEVADAVGAGDAFTAALIFAQLSGWPVRSTAHFANEVGALVASMPGAMPSCREQLDELRARFEPRDT